MDYHMLSGYAVLTLIIFRILWGFLGGRYARFSSFIYSPARIINYLQSITAKQPSTIVGHNPAGGLSVLVMLVLLLGQGVTGLFTNDDIMLEGPLTHLVSYELSRSLTGIHETISWLLAAIITLHILAILFYRIVKKQNLVKTMITGSMEIKSSVDKSGDSDEALDRGHTKEGNYWFRGLLLLGFCSGLTYGIINYL